MVTQGGMWDSRSIRGSFEAFWCIGPLGPQLFTKAANTLTFSQRYGVGNCAAFWMQQLELKNPHKSVHRKFLIVTKLIVNPFSTVKFHQF